MAELPGHLAAGCRSLPAAGRLLKAGGTSGKLGKELKEKHYHAGAKALSQRLRPGLELAAAFHHASTKVLFSPESAIVA